LPQQTRPREQGVAIGGNNQSKTYKSNNTVGLVFRFQLKIKIIMKHMKNFILVIILGIGIQQMSWSQGNKIGFQFGMTSSNVLIAANDYVKTTPIGDTYLGFHYSKRGAKKYGLTVEVAVIGKGAVKNYYDGYWELLDVTRYIIVPVLFDYYLSDKFVLSVGLEPGYRSNMKRISIASPTPSTMVIKDNDIDYMDLGIVGGISYNIFEHFDVVLRTGLSLTQTSINPIVGEETNFDGLKERYICLVQFILRFKIDIDK
jgi:hypothetical protein